MMTLKRWHIIGNCVIGCVYNDTRKSRCTGRVRENGTWIKTSEVVGITNGVLTTKNSTYKLED